MSKLWMILVVLNIIFIYYNGLQDATASSQASNQVVEVTEDILETVNVEVERDVLTEFIRSLAHVVQYLTLGFLSTLMLLSMKQSLGYLYMSGVVMLSDEWLQTFVPGRAFEVTDLGLDVLGFSIGAFVILFVILGRKLICVES